MLETPEAAPTWAGATHAVDADVAEDRQARANAKDAALGMLVVYDDIPEYDEETLRRGEEAWRELGPEVLRILNEDRSTGL